MYDLMGGRAGCRMLSEAFYARIAKDPLLRPLFPGKSLRCAIEAFAAYLAQLLGGPAEDARRRWWLSLRESHERFRIGAAQREAWMSHMVQALDEVAIEESARVELLALFERASAYLVNEGEQPIARAKTSPLWNAQAQVDEAVAAIRGGDAARAIALSESSGFQTCGLVALMIRSGDEVLLRYARERVRREPALVQERIRFGRTLLHEAAAAGSLAMTEFLLGLGAEVDARDRNGHTPLYSLANECVAGGADVVGALMGAGADVNAASGVKRCTPLHMAARRGNVEVAAALLDCGANLEARDSVGDTPLRRAVNCRKGGVASLLVARGFGPKIGSW